MHRNIPGLVLRVTPDKAFRGPLIPGRPPGHSPGWILTQPPLRFLPRPARPRTQRCQTRRCTLRWASWPLFLFRVAVWHVLPTFVAFRPILRIRRSSKTGATRCVIISVLIRSSRLTHTPLPHSLFKLKTAIRQRTCPGFRGRTRAPSSPGPCTQRRGAWTHFFAGSGAGSRSRQTACT